MEKLIKPSDGNMLDTIGFEGIENKIPPEMFYNLLSIFKNDKFGNQRTTFTVSAYHYSLMEIIRNGDLVRARESDMIRALVGTGTLASARQKGICGRQVKAVISNCKYHRTENNMRKFEISLSKLDLNDERTKKFLKEIVIRYGNNPYGKEIWNRIWNSWDTPKVQFAPGEIVVSGYLKNQCRNITKKPLQRKMYELKSENSNKQLKVNMSERFYIIGFEYAKSFCEKKLFSAYLRGFFVTGLFILAKWILKNKISREEYDFFKLIHCIDSFAAES